MLEAMAHIRKGPRKGKGGGRRMAYEVRYRDPARRERVRTFPRKIDAELFAATIDTDIARGQYVDPVLGKVSFADFSRGWLGTTGHLKPKTREGYESILRTHLFPAFGDRPIAKVRPVEVGQFFSDLADGGMSVSRMRQTKNVLKRIFDEALRNGYLARTPVEAIRLPRPQRREMSVLSPSQVSLLASNVPERYEALIFLLAYGGLRWGEAAALRRGRFNVLRGRVEVMESVSEVNGVLHFGSTKTHQVRSVALPLFLKDLLGEHLNKFVEDDVDALVFTTKNRTNLRIGNFRRRVWWPALDAADLPRSVRIHDLRHTCASMLIARGAQAKAIQQHLGHSSITITFDVYGHLLPDEQNKIAAALDETYGSAQSYSRASEP
jgi:integrase